MAVNAKTAEAGETLVISRLIEAPRALVWAAWTEPEHMQHWMGPADHPMVASEGEFRVGGAWRACLRSTADGRELWQGGIYKEIVPQSRLVQTMTWDGQSAEMLVTVEFADDGANKTRMTFTQERLPSVAERDGHRAGWTSSFERLDRYIAEIA